MKTILISLVFLFASENSLPKLNQRIVTYLDEVMGTKVDRGECWDLAAGALAYSGAYFDRSSKKTVLIYGRLLNPKKEAVLPGDLIQFENVKMEWQEGNATYYESMLHHTAIVYKVNAESDFEIAHQNTGKWGKKVGVSNFRLDRMKKGKVMIYRPVDGKP